ncbi:hypothetical protein Tco_0197076, partial [Tanacetum coccineum]
AKNCLEVLRTQFEEFFASQGVNSSDHLHQCLQQDFKDYMYCKPETYRCDVLKNLDILEDFIDKSVIKYGELWMKENEVNALKKTGKQLNAEILHEHEIEKSFKLQSKDVQINLVQAVDASLVIMKSSGIELENNSSENALSKLVYATQMQMQEGKVDMGKALNVGLVVKESSKTESDKQVTSSRSGNDTAYAVDADIRLVNDQETFAEVQLIAQHNVLANEQQHTEQFEPIYDTYLLENVDSNTTPDSKNIT